MASTKRSRPDSSDCASASAKKTKFQTCCSCLEMKPDLLLIGCSNMHTICHVCSRDYISSKINLSHFPTNFPGNIRSRDALCCPLCQERIHGITNIFCQGTVWKPARCPYHEELEPHSRQALGCDTVFPSVELLRNHLLKQHTNSVRCPNCRQWLYGDRADTMEFLLRRHVMMDCHSIECKGCCRTGNMVSMYLHSAIGSGTSAAGSTCDSANVLVQDFTQALHKPKFDICVFIVDLNRDKPKMTNNFIRFYLYFRFNRLAPAIKMFI